MRRLPMSFRAQRGISTAAPSTGAPIGLRRPRFLVARASRNDRWRRLLLAFPFLQLLVPLPAAASTPSIGGCPVFPTDNVWNTPVDKLPVDPRSAAYVNSIGASTGLH